MRIALAFAGAFLHFAGLACGFGCPPIPGPPPGSFSGATVASTDGRIVVALLVAAATATSVCLARRHKSRTSSTALLLWLMAVVLVSFESLNAAVRVLGWPFAIPTSPERGYYLLQVGSAMGAGLSQSRSRRCSRWCDKFIRCRILSAT